MIRLACSQCRAPLEFPPQMAGATGPCWSCGKAMQVPLPPMLTIACPRCNTASDYSSQLVGQSGPCRQCGTSITVDPRSAMAPPVSGQHPHGPPPRHAPPRQPPPSGPQDVAPNRVQVAVGKNLEKEAAKVNHRVLGVRTVQIANTVSTGENVGQALKTRFLFGGKLRTDRVQAVKLATQWGHYFVVIPWSGNLMLPHEYVSVLPGNIPSSLWLTRGAMGSWSSGKWSGSLNGEQDPTAALADKEYKLNDGIEWDWESGRMKIKLQWGMQVVPHRPGFVLHHVKSAQRGIILKDFGLNWYVQRQKAFAEFAAQLQPSADPPRYQFEPLSTLFASEINA